MARSLKMQTLVAPEEIEHKLRELWESLPKKNKLRARLFQLIVYAELGCRSDDFRTVIAKVIENYPCRILFLSKDPDPDRSYLKTAVSVVDTKEQSDIASDSIDIGYAGDAEKKVLSLVLSHLVTDLPAHLLWLDTPSPDHPLFLKLEKLCTRVLIDAGSSSTLATFIKGLRSYLPVKTAHLSDINWTRIGPWRKILATEFVTKEEKTWLQKAKEVHICYNNEKNAYIPHPETETLYFLCWLATKLGWKYEKKEDTRLFFSSGFAKPSALMKTAKIRKERPGAILSVHIYAEDAFFSLERRDTAFREIVVQMTSKTTCAVPKTITLKDETRGASVSAELLKKQTSLAYLDTMELLWHL